MGEKIPIEISLISQFLLLASSEIKWSPRQKTQVISLVSSLVFWRDFNNVSDSLLRDNKIPNEISLISHLLLLDGNEIKLKPNWVPDILHENDPSYLTYCMSPLEEASPLEVIEEIIEEGSQDEKYCTSLLTRFIFEHCNKPFKVYYFLLSNMLCGMKSRY